MGLSRRKQTATQSKPRAAGPKTPEELRDWLWQHLGVRIPDVQVCPNHSTPWRAFCDAFFGLHLVVIWKASRGLGGKTYLLSVLGDAEAVLLGADVTILGGSGEQSERVQEYVSDWLAKEPAVNLVKDNTREARLANGARLRALMASSRSVRGPHPQRVHIDEADEVLLKLVNAALGQAMAKNGVSECTVMSSTHHYARGPMTELLKRAKANPKWAVHEWCWRESYANGAGWLTEQQIEAKRSVVTAQMWNTEYDLQQPSAEGRAIDPGKVEAMFSVELGEFDGAEGQYIEIEAPQHGASYVTGADWARKVDWTIILTWRIDVYPYKLVAFERSGRRPWPDMTAKFDQRVKRFPGAAYFDQTGVGDVVAGYLTVAASGVMMVARPRAEMLTSYITSIERGMLVAPRINWMYQEHLLASVADVYGSAPDLTGTTETAEGEGGRVHLPDTIAAGALANLGMPKQYTGGVDAWIAAMQGDAGQAPAGVDYDTARAMVQGLASAGVPLAGATQPGPMRLG